MATIDDEARRRLGHALDGDPVIAAYVFGSQARGTAGPGSDVDVAVWVAGDVAPRRQLELIAAAGEALGTSALDFVVLDRAPALLRHRVLRDGVRVLDRDPVQRVRREARAISEYLDTQALRAELSRGLAHRLQEDRFGRPRHR